MLKLLDAVIFHVIAGNADAHGKNFSILHDGEGVLAVARELYALSRSFLVSGRHQKALRLGLSKAENPVVTSQPLA